MCGRYVSPDQAAIERFWHIGRHNPPRWWEKNEDVAPTTSIPIITKADDGTLELQAARWGLIPHWWKQEKPPTKTFNARSEEAAAKPMWKGPLKSSRCLVPACGWYEWKDVEEPGTGRKRKRRYYIHSPHAEIIAIAGLYAIKDTLTSCTVMTKNAAHCIEDIHPRMPVVLEEIYYDEWLRPEISPERIQTILEHSRKDFSAD